MKIAGKQIYKKCLVVLICLLVFGNLAHKAVLCFGSDECGSIELRSAECCEDCFCVPIQPAPNPCVHCISIPIYTGLENITRVAKQLNSTFSAPAMIAPTDKSNHSAYSLVSNTFDAASYFAPLCTVILLI